MNANELADKLENEVNMFDHPCASHAADMLRQLQAENEALKNARCVACGWNPKLIRPQVKEEND